MLTYLELKQTPHGKYSRFETKYLRCRKIEELLASGKRVNRANLAELFNVSKSTITRYIQDLGNIIPIEEDRGRFLYVNKN